MYNYFGLKQKDTKCSRFGGDIKALIIHTIIEKYTHTVYASVSFRWVLCLNTVCHIREVLHNTALQTRNEQPDDCFARFYRSPFASHTLQISPACLCQKYTLGVKKSRFSVWFSHKFSASITCSHVEEVWTRTLPLPKENYVVVGYIVHSISKSLQVGVSRELMWLLAVIRSGDVLWSNNVYAAQAADWTNEFIPTKEHPHSVTPLFPVRWS